jgi:signal transduction histidine kinase
VLRRARIALWPAGFAFGAAVEWIVRPELMALDAAVGFVLVGLGLVVWSRRSESLAGPIMVGTGFAWFLGTVAGWAVYLHRAPLAQLVLTYPSGRIPRSSRLQAVALVTAYAYAAAYPVAGNHYASIAFGIGLVALSAVRYASVGGPERRARATALAAATLFASALVLDAALRLADVGRGRVLLTVYDVAVCLVATVLFLNLVRRRWAQATVTGLVVDLGEPDTAGTLRDRLARTLGDPTLVVGYWLVEQNAYVDETGRQVQLPAAADERGVTSIMENGAQIAVLIHDAAVLDDPELVSGVAAATRLAVSNARLQVEVQARLVEVEASRRRIVEAADEQRRRLELELRGGAQRRLGRVAELVADVGPGLGDQLRAAQAELQEFARGIHPALLTEGGLVAAVRELAARCPVAAEVRVPSERFPAPVEAAAYFVCSEALANAAKHADATQVRIGIVRTDARLEIEIADDGIGGADLSAGSGLRGLADRVESLGGQLRLASAPGGGTLLTAWLPI